MNVSAWSIRNPIPAILLFLLLTIVGLGGFRAMKIQNYPDIELPIVSVSASLPGAAPAQLETEVVRKIENSVATLQGIKHIYSTAQDGQVTVSLEFVIEKPIQEATEEVRDAVARVRSDLPGEMRDPIVAKANLASMPVLTYTIASEKMDDVALSWFVDNNVSKALLGIKGVGAVNRVGGVNRQIRVELDPDRLLALRTTAADISRQLRQVQQEASGGRTDVGDAEQSIRTIATVQTGEELAALQIPLSDGRSIRLDQVADVQDTVGERRSLALLNGKPVVGFEIVRSKGASEVDVMNGVRAELERMKDKHPDVVVDEAFNFVTPVVENYDGSMSLMYEGAVLAVLVVWFFLRDWRATIVSATALPLSIIPAFGVMHLFGFTINMVTLLSLSLVIGILVDDAIVEIENIIRHLQMGKSPYQAAMEAADEIGLAVIATTFSLIAVFLPTAFMTGIVGKFFVQFGWAAAISVFFSLVVARMLTPMMAAYTLRPKTRGHVQARWEKAYMRLATWCLQHRVATSAATVAFFLGVLLVLMPQLPEGFMPADDVSQTQVSIELPPGSTLEQTYTVTRQVEAIVGKSKQVKHIYTTIGGGNAGGNAFDPSGAGGGIVTKATLTIGLVPRGERPGISKQLIEDEFRRAIEVVPGARLKVGMGDSSEKYELALTGDDGRKLRAHAEQVLRELRTIPSVGLVTSSSSLVRPEVVVRPDFAKAGDLGVSSVAIAETLRIATAGDYDQDIAKLNLSERQIPVIVKLRDDARKDVELLSRLYVPGARGPVMLGNIADVSLDSGPAQVDRLDRIRNINMRVELNGQPLGEVENAALELPSLKDLPAGVTITPVGDAEAMGELFEGFVTAMLTGILCIYIVLVLLFKDFVQPITILAALVLSVPGAILALFVTHSALSMPALIGLIMLMGVATKNSILLVEYAIMARRNRGLSRIDALLDACSKRARPIVMTTVAMGAGMLPIALGMGNDPSFRAPMAIVIIGGLITSTFLSLLVIPVIFTLVDDVREAALRLIRRLRGQAAVKPAGGAVEQAVEQAAEQV